jgi:hypothetical protein
VFSSYQYIFLAVQFFLFERSSVQISLKQVHFLDDAVFLSVHFLGFPFCSTTHFLSPHRKTFSSTPSDFEWIESQTIKEITWSYYTRIKMHPKLQTLLVRSLDVAASIINKYPRGRKMTIKFLEIRNRILSGKSDIFKKILTKCPNLESLKLAELDQWN